MAQDSKKDYLTLLEAAKLCPHSEAYLRLRARQGKLKLIKIGRKWMTTKHWIYYYIQRARDWNEKMAVKRSGKEPEAVALAGVATKPSASVPNMDVSPAITYSLPQIHIPVFNADLESIP